MVTIQATGKINGHKVNWLFTGSNEKTVAQSASKKFARNGLKMINYIIL